MMISLSRDDLGTKCRESSRGEHIPRGSCCKHMLARALLGDAAHTSGPSVSMATQISPSNHPL